MRVWSAKDCAHCQDEKWLTTIRRFDEVPGVGIQRLDFHKYRDWCQQNGILRVPAVQLFDVGDAEPVEIGRLDGAVGLDRLMSMLSRGAER